MKVGSIPDIRPVASITTHEKHSGEDEKPNQHGHSPPYVTRSTNTDRRDGYCFSNITLWWPKCYTERYITSNISKTKQTLKLSLSPTVKEETNVSIELKRLSNFLTNEQLNPNRIICSKSSYTQIIHATDSPIHISHFRHHQVKAVQAQLPQRQLPTWILPSSCADINNSQPLTIIFSLGPMMKPIPKQRRNRHILKPFFGRAYSNSFPFLR